VLLLAGEYDSCRGSIRVSRECPFALRRFRRSEPGSQRVAQSGIGAIPHPGDVSIGSDQHGSGGCYLAQPRKLPIAGILGVDRQRSVCPWSDVEVAGLTEVEEHRPGIVQQGEYPQRAVGGDQVQIGHVASEQRVSLAEFVMNVQTGHHRGESFARLVHAEELGNGVAQGVDTRAGAQERALRHGVLQHAGSDRVALGMVGIQEAFWRRLVDHLGQLPSQVHRILHTGVEALSTRRGMHVRRVAGQQDPSVSVGRGLPGHIGEPGDPGGTVDPVIGPVYGDERLADVAQGGFAGGSDVRFGHHDPYRPAILVDHLAVADLVLHPTERVDAEGVVADTQVRLLDVPEPLESPATPSKRTISSLGSPSRFPETWALWQFTEVEAPRRLGLVISFADANRNVAPSPFGGPWPARIAITVTLERHAGIAAFREAMSSMEVGWGQTLESLASFLSTAW
jgi:hypothetical protein